MKLEDDVIFSDRHASKTKRLHIENGSKQTVPGLNANAEPCVPHTSYPVEHSVSKLSAAPNFDSRRQHAHPGHETSPPTYKQVLMQTWQPIPKYSAVDIASACKFKGPHDILSNFSYSPMVVDGFFFNNLESAYHYDKAQTSNRKDIADKLTTCLRGIDAYRLGHSFKGYVDSVWYEKRVAVMERLIDLKCDHCPEYVEALLDTGDRLILKDTTHPFSAWTNGKGRNMHGILEMKKQDKLRQS